jgi:hypothetical protein
MKRIITVLLALIVLMCMMMPCSASTDTTLPTSFKVPGKPVARETGCYTSLLNPMFTISGICAFTMLKPWVYQVFIFTIRWIGN